MISCLLPTTAKPYQTGQTYKRKEFGSNNILIIKLYIIYIQNTDREKRVCWPKPHGLKCPLGTSFPKGAISFFKQFTFTENACKNENACCFP